eukprot:5247529-Karenia_brevis.AAC.1
MYIYTWKSATGQQHNRKWIWRVWGVGLRVLMLLKGVALADKVWNVTPDGVFEKDGDDGGCDDD